ncbi:glycosyltransferase family 4 protein [Cohaesibacter haloalkalitolerans]|uniref:glycosyltransferase family 4 protein n=1 Tax=Cohaesibacter haloalkalitolerans TaxID=1162980 RepID=UPI0013C4B302|nr:glycosyltransferase family 1 protein [Cohaesibacter haloalkalitolerans]
MTDRWDRFVETDHVIYDFTRLVLRRHDRFATGIDRIDLAFAEDLAASFGDRLIFAVMVGKGGLLLSCDEVRPLLQELARRWGGVRVDRSVSSARSRDNTGDPFARLILLEKARQKLSLGADNRFMRQLKALLAGRPATYIVANHHGFARISGFLDRLQTEIDLRVRGYIHDLIPIRYPEYIRPGHIGRQEAYLDAFRQAGGQLFANSETTARDIACYCAEQGWQCGPVEVLLPALAMPDLRAGEPCAKVREIVATGKPYFVTVGTIEPRKNHLLLLHMWRRWVREGRADLPHLHVVGQRGWQNESVFQLLDRCSAIRPHVSEHGDLDDVDLFHLVLHARALLFPSFAEGLGLPMLEADRLGVPVIASDLAVFRELALERATLLDPLDVPSWQEACLRAIKL